jgi:RNA polymerase sigma factor (sigma-70 family)
MLGFAGGFRHLFERKDSERRLEDDLRKLVERAKRSDAGAFGELIRRCERTALAVACAQLGDGHRAADAVQEAFLRAWQKLADLDDSGRFKAWLCGIVRNVAIDHRRGRKMVGLDDAPTNLKLRDPVQDADRSEMSREISAAVATLDEISRSAVVLKYYENLSSKEIGELLGISASAVDMRLSRARQELKPLLAKTLVREA